MITSDKRDNIDRQNLLIAINSRPESMNNAGVLPYDPNAAPDTSFNPQVLATNYLDNSDYDFSKDAYLNSPVVGGDQAEEAYNWYRQRFRKLEDVGTTAASNAITSASNPFLAAYTYPMDFVLLNGAASGVALSGYLNRNAADGAALLYSDVAMVTPLNVTPTLTNAVLWFGETLSEAGGILALKSSTHSLYAANEGANTRIPRWDKTNGWAEIGSDQADQQYDLACPLPVNFIRGGLVYYFRCIVALRSGASIGDAVRLSAGIWDSTTAEKRFIEGANFDLAVTPVGTTGATTYTYVVLADLDDGTTIVSDAQAIANGNAALSTTNYNRLTWENSTGVLRFRIYRSVGGVIKRIFTITNGGTDYNDYGTDEGETPGALPTASAVRSIVYRVSTSFNPTTSWVAVLIRMEIPGTYDTSRTTGKQWLRIGVEGLCGSERMLLIDRVSLATSDGGWQRSARDFNKILNQNPSSLPTETDQGNTGVEYCFVLDTPILICEEDGSNIRAIPIGEASPGMFVLSGDQRPNLITHVKDGVSKLIVSCELSNGVAFDCSPSERFITSRADTKGTRIDALTLGDEILCWNNGRAEKATIESYAIYHESTPIRTLSLKPRKTFIVGAENGCGAIAHNLKPGDFILYL